MFSQSVSPLCHLTTACQSPTVHSTVQMFGAFCEFSCSEFLDLDLWRSAANVGLQWPISDSYSFSKVGLSEDV
ncbi:hypothetical protein MPTK1_5g00510 [Marchantia polymorpha subsp. ruderalis]|uniref:Uncharacterized protein n=2 Tax=Marchantia polymorpha TaxID=3197 RepID=A0AAF6BDH1_MARPO|nr:hypothetical protein MARPO_0078s0050 [Marchantia polymorpha]BBN10055.1 hypothetical protein Mp_5g00510 [Marchantia polymorpha subsp. ruderalis]|eukprot:PTQ34648.1 hypothetical protein MARPO_0078s0050 [Marchantia polymorpha]